MLTEHVSTASGSESPDEDCDPSDWNNDGLRHEQPSEIIRMHVQEWYLSKPEDDEGDQGIACNALTGRDMIRQGEETRPDGADHDTHGIGTIHGLNGEPEDGQNGTRDDGDVGAPEAPAGS